jgi:RNA polymerase sigma factor (sigma-70 family)
VVRRRQLVTAVAEVIGLGAERLADPLCDVLTCRAERNDARQVRDLGAPASIRFLLVHRSRRIRSRQIVQTTRSTNATQRPNGHRIPVVTRNHDPFLRSGCAQISCEPLCRTTGDAHDAADVVAEVFLVAWRRLDDVPSGEGGRLWLYGVARHALANQQRSERRRERLAERLRRELPAALQSIPPPAPETEAIRAALGGLGSEDQEILRLAVWEELTPGEVATVLGISPIAARSRLHRARRRLRAALQREPEQEEPSPVCLQEAL